MKDTKHTFALKEIYSKTTTITSVHCVSTIFLLLILIQFTEQADIKGVLLTLVGIFLNNKMCEILHRKGV